MCTSPNVTEASRFSFTNAYGTSRPPAFMSTYADVAIDIVFRAWLQSRRRGRGKRHAHDRQRHIVRLEEQRFGADTKRSRQLGLHCRDAGGHVLPPRRPRGAARSGPTTRAVTVMTSGRSYVPWVPVRGGQWPGSRRRLEARRRGYRVPRVIDGFWVAVPFPAAPSAFRSSSVRARSWSSRWSAWFIRFVFNTRSGITNSLPSEGKKVSPLFFPPTRPSSSGRRRRPPHRPRSHQTRSSPRSAV